METISNQARVSYSYEGSTETYTNDSNIVNSSMKDQYSILVEKTATSNCFKAGDTITYMIHVTNNGCACLGRFEIIDRFENDEFTSYVEGSARLFVNGSMHSIVPTDLSPLSFEISDKLEKDAELILQFNVLVSANIDIDVLELINEVNVRAYPCNCYDDSGLSVEETASLSIPKCEYAEVLITKAVSNDNLCCGEELDYIITLTNIGTVDATNVVITDQLPTSFTATEIHSENNGVHYKYDLSEYDIDGVNFLTLPNATGTIIEVPAIAPGVDNTTRIRIHGHM